jgi:nucleoside-diphosphate-sugar epimerase
MESILVAGGSGLIGRALTTRLGKSDASVRVRALGGSQNVDFKSKNVEYLKRDLRDGNGLEALLEGFDTVVFCAGGAGGMGQFKAHASQMALDACLMNSNLLKACVAASVKRIVMIASATSYPSIDGVISEDDMDMNVDPAPAYLGLGCTWRYLEKMARWLGQEHSIEMVVLRTANVFGPFGRFDPKSSNFIPALIRKAVAKNDPFEVHGSPSVTRDVLFVEDLVDALMKLLGKNELGIQTFNMGSGYATRVGDVAEWALKYAGFSPSQGILYTKSDYGAPASRCLGTSRLNDFIDWQPPVSAEKGIEQLVAWWTENRNTWSR